MLSIILLTSQVQSYQYSSKTIQSLHTKCDTDAVYCSDDYQMECKNGILTGEQCPPNYTCVKSKGNIQCELRPTKCDLLGQRCYDNHIVQCVLGGIELKVKDCKTQECVEKRTNGLFEVSCIPKKECYFIGLKKIGDIILKCEQGIKKVYKCEPGTVLTELANGSLDCLKICKEGTSKCLDNQRMRCIDGTFVPEPCLENQTCQDGQCLSQCNSTKDFCKENKIIKCIKGNEIEVECPANTFCSEENKKVECSLSCKENELRCKGSNKEQCIKNKFVKIRNCSPEKCIMENDVVRCTDECPFEGSKCFENKIVRCIDDNKMIDKECPNECVEVNGVAQCMDTCKNGEAKCLNGDLITCENNQWKTKDCGDSRVCKTINNKTKCYCNFSPKCRNNSIVQCDQKSGEESVSQCPSNKICFEKDEKAECQSKCDYKQRICKEKQIFECQKSGEVFIEKCEDGCKIVEDQAQCITECPYQGTKCKGDYIAHCEGEKEVLKKCDTEFTCSLVNKIPTCVKKCDFKKMRCQNGLKLECVNSIEVLTPCQNNQICKNNECVIEKCKDGEICEDNKICKNGVCIINQCNFQGLKCDGKKLVKCKNNKEVVIKVCKAYEICGKNSKNELDCILNPNRCDPCLVCKDNGVYECKSNGKEVFNKCPSTSNCVVANNRPFCISKCVKNETKCEKNNLLSCNNGTGKLTICKNGCTKTKNGAECKP